MSYITRFRLWARAMVLRLPGHARNLMRGWVWRQGGRMWRRMRARRGKTFARL
jgi:hypothetical protein